MIDFEESTATTYNFFQIPTGRSDSVFQDEARQVGAGWGGEEQKRCWCWGDLS